MRRLVFTFGIVMAMTLPGLAQPGGQHPRPDTHGPSARPLDRAPRPDGTSRRMRLPQPNHGGPSLNERSWRAGRWYHGSHNGRFGWWWTVGPQWFFYDRPAYPFPDIYGPAGAVSGWWYWCDAYQDYYPFVTRCPSGWRTVPPR